MEKAIDIKRRAQRFITSGDVDAALIEYEKLARSEENEPYHSVVIADLLYKKGDQTGASQRYLVAVDGYEKAGLYKNGMAVCKKMARLGLAPGLVFKRLAQLHAADGLTTEAGLFHMQHAEYALRIGDFAEAARAFRLAFESSNENVAALERLAELHRSNAENEQSLAVFAEAVAQYERLGQLAEARRCRRHMRQIDPTLPPEPELVPESAPENGAAPDSHPAPAGAVQDLEREPSTTAPMVERLQGLTAGNAGLGRPEVTQERPVRGPRT